MQNLIYVSAFLMMSFSLPVLAAQDVHFDAKGHLPSAVTQSFQKQRRDTLPFSDKRDFEEVQQGLLAKPDSMQIKDDKGNVVWDMQSYQWLLQGKDFDSIHPSLQRQAELNMGYGLYEVLPGKIWQVRGFDLANMTLIKGNTGWIIFDVLTSRETAAAALKLANDHLGKRPAPKHRPK